MDRIPEPELMDEVEQARAYAAADFPNLTNHSLNISASDLQTTTPSRCLIWVAGRLT